MANHSSKREAAHCRECQPIKDAISELERLMLFAKLTHNAFRQGQALVDQLRAHRNMEHVLYVTEPGKGRELTKCPHDEGFEQFLESQIMPIQDFARQEMKRDTPFLHALAAIRLWGILEAAVDDMVGMRLIRPENRQHSRLRKVKGPVFEYMALPEEDRAEHLVELLKQELGSSLELGVGRFEGLLEVVGFGGPVDQNVRRLLLELSQIRHALVHRNGVADAKLLRQCPWLPYAKGDNIEITSEQFGAYEAASLIYLSELIRRHFTDIGEEVPKSVVEVIEDGGERLRERRKQAAGDCQTAATSSVNDQVPASPIPRSKLSPTESFATGPKGDRLSELTIVPTPATPATRATSVEDRRKPR